MQGKLSLSLPVSFVDIFMYFYTIFMHVIHQSTEKWYACCLLSYTKNLICGIYFLCSAEDSEVIFRDADSLNMTGAGYVWLVTEQSLDAPNVPNGLQYSELYRNFFSTKNLMNECNDIYRSSCFESRQRQ